MRRWIEIFLAFAGLILGLAQSVLSKATDLSFMVKDYKLGCSFRELQSVPFKAYPSTNASANLIEIWGMGAIENFPSPPRSANKTPMHGSVDLNDDRISNYHQQMVSPKVHCYAYFAPDEIRKDNPVALISFASLAASPRFMTVTDGANEKLYRVLLTVANPPGPITIGYKTYQSKKPLPLEKEQLDSLKAAMRQKYGAELVRREGTLEWIVGRTRILFDESESLISFEDTILKKLTDPPVPEDTKPKKMDPQEMTKDM